MPAEAEERFVPVAQLVGGGERLVYRPVLIGQVSAHYTNSRAGIDEWTQRILSAPLDPDLDGSPWSKPFR